MSVCVEAQLFPTVDGVRVLTEVKHAVVWDCNFPRGENDLCLNLHLHHLRGLLLLHPILACEFVCLSLCMQVTLALVCVCECVMWCLVCQSAHVHASHAFASVCMCVCVCLV